jgi:hypothetical protein
VRRGAYVRSARARQHGNDRRITDARKVQDDISQVNIARANYYLDLKERRKE